MDYELRYDPETAALVPEEPSSDHYSAQPENPVHPNTSTQGGDRSETQSISEGRQDSQDAQGTGQHSHDSRRGGSGSEASGSQR